MLNVKQQNGNTLFKKVNPKLNRVDMIILTPNHTLHIQCRSFGGNIVHENKIEANNRRHALAIIKGFYMIPGNL